MKPHLMPSFNTMESHTTGKPSPMPSDAPLQPTGQMHPILRECLAAGEAALQSPLLQEAAKMILARNKAYRLSLAKKQPQD